MGMKVRVLLIAWQCVDGWGSGMGMKVRSVSCLAVHVRELVTSAKRVYKLGSLCFANTLHIKVELGARVRDLVRVIRVIRVADRVRVRVMGYGLWVMG
jgi:hypothetical protein